MLDFGGVNQRVEQSPGRIEAAVEGFEQNGAVRLVQLWQVEEDFGFGRVGYGRLFKQDMLAGTDGPDSPLKM